MRVLKLVVEGSITSFRYPHFVQGVHLTFEMPPPATIYGHLCSAVGDYLPRNYTRFAYHFTYAAKFFDYEHLHFFGKDPKMNPFKREQLYNPRLVLYLDNLDLYPALVSPEYAVALGRAQDLMTYVSIEPIELQTAEAAFYEATLLPLDIAAQIGGRSYAVTMPRFLDENRVPTWGQYAVLHNRISYPTSGGFRMARGFPIWVDPSKEARHPAEPLQRGIIWHSWE